MTFITPWFTGGRSVMLEVAKGGGSGTGSSLAGADGECVRTQGELMPLLFMFPRFGWKGTYAMLGYGDIVIPGLLLCFACRFDYIRQGYVFRCFPPLRGAFRDDTGYPASARGPLLGYSVFTWIGYSVGLLLAMLANMLHITINNVQGQPALLYICPCMMIALLGVACCRGELKEIWEGAIVKEEWKSGAGQLLTACPCCRGGEAAQRSGRAGSTAADGTVGSSMTTIMESESADSEALLENVDQEADELGAAGMI